MSYRGWWRREPARAAGDRGRLLDSAVYRVTINQHERYVQWSVCRGALLGGRSQIDWLIGQRRSAFDERRHVTVDMPVSWVIWSLILASRPVIITAVYIVKTKCLPVLCYAIEVCPANKSDIRSLQYDVDNCFRKIFDIKLKETVEECMREFNVLTVNDVIDAKKRKFLAKYSVSENSLCQVFARMGNLR